MRPADLPPRERWADAPHGTRLRHISGCRCLACRAAHSRDVSRYRRLSLTGKGNPLVSAEPMRAHLLALRRVGVGYKRAATMAKVGHTTVFRVLSGDKTQVRKRTSEAILALPLSPALLAPSTLIDAGPTWRLVRRMLADGYPALRIARFLGQQGSGLQIGKRKVEVKTAEKVRALAGWLLAEEQAS
jgi:hypothetical protein